VNLEEDSNVYRLKSLINSSAFTIGSYCSEFLTKVNLSRGVWPPPDAESQMMESALLVASSVKELVNSTKTAILEYQEVRFSILFKVA